MADDNQLNPPPLSILPQTSPIGPGLPQPSPQMPTMASMPGTANLDDATQFALQQGKYGVQQMGKSLGRMQGYENTAADLSNQAAQLAPHLSFHPDFSGGIGHKIGEGLLSFLAATKPGQAVQDVVYSKPRQQYADLIRNIQAQKGLAETEKGALEPEAQMGYHPMYSAVRGATEQAKLPIEQMDANTRRLAVDNSNRLRQEALNIEKDLGNKKITVEQAAVRMKQVVAEIMQSTATTVAGTYADQRQAAAQMEASQQYLKTEGDYFLQRIMGLLPEPPVGTAAGNPPPGAPAANAPAQNAPAKNAKPQKKAEKVEKWGRNKNGRMVRLQ